MQLVFLNKFYIVQLCKCPIQGRIHNTISTRKGKEMDNISIHFISIILNNYFNKPNLFWGIEKVNKNI